MPHSAELARRVWQRLEVIHAVSYFAPEAGAALEDVGYRGFWMGYFAARSAPLGAVGPEVVGALFYNFSATRVGGALPDAWSIAGPDLALSARRSGANAALRRILGDTDVTEAAELAATAARGAPIDGRTLFAANAALPWPTEPIDLLWHAATLLREHRGDGHVALLVANAVGARECNVFQAAGGNVPRAMIQRARDYDDAEWDAVTAALAERGLLTPDGTLTAGGTALRERIETRTDELAASAYDALTDSDLARLIDLLTPLARAIVAIGEIPSATPMGPTLPD